MRIPNYPPAFTDTSSHLQRSAALKIEWAKVTSSLGLKGQTAASLLAFKKRNEDARRKVNLLQSQPQKIDFAHYRATLKNQAVVDEIERSFRAFKPATVDVPKQLKAIEAFEAQAVLNAMATKDKVDAELADLQKTLTNIEEARPFEDLTVVCIKPWDWIEEEEWGWGDWAFADWGREGRMCRGLQYLILLFDMEVLHRPPLSHSGCIFVYIMQPPPHSTPSFTCDVLERKLTRSP